MKADFELIAAALTDTASLTGLSLRQWDLLIRQARRADVLARIAEKCQAAGVLPRLPAQARLHLESALVVADRQAREVRWEVRMIRDALAECDVPLLLLKGGAYALLGLEASRGRTMADIDILVPRDRLPDVETALLKRGWSTTITDAYDQRYYRTWMHELPPLRHIHRETSLDVHHAIAPLTARTRPDTAALWNSARRARADGIDFMTLAPADLLLHSASHLFHEGEFEHAFRGLLDLDSLFRELGAEAQFWQGLVPRAVQMQLARPLFYALRYSERLLRTPVPASAMEALRGHAGFGPSSLLLVVMDSLFLRALRPLHPSCSDSWSPLARGLLYLRSHWLRMPPLLLTLHLSRKALMALRPKPAPAQVA